MKRQNSKKNTTGNRLTPQTQRKTRTLKFTEPHKTDFLRQKQGVCLGVQSVYRQITFIDRSASGLHPAVEEDFKLSQHRDQYCYAHCLWLAQPEELDEKRVVQAPTCHWQWQRQPHATKWRASSLCLVRQFYRLSPHMPSRRSLAQLERATPAGLLASCLVDTTLIGSLLIMGLSASIVAHDHSSSIGITHLVVVSGMSILGNKHPVHLISLWSVCSSYSVHSSLYALPSPDKIEQTWHKHGRSSLSSSRRACTLDRSSLCPLCLLRERTI